ncbi:MAG: DUF3782 domain-containing protein, partial [Acidobacteriota bacterium]|nr:DUF3782 domain-containing protein [Acidobacteriota bacterium]
QRFDQIEQHLTAHDQRFDQVDQRLSTHDQLLEDLRAEVAKVAVSVGALGGRMGWKMEDVIRRVIEHFSGLRKLKAKPFTIIDDTGECFQSGATIEFDALVTNGRKFLVEVKSYAKPGDVWAFHRKARFAEKKLNETFDKVLIAPAASQAALDLANELGITCYTFSVEG